jgi:arylsulfatase A-like enzyme
MIMNNMENKLGFSIGTLACASFFAFGSGNAEAQEKKNVLFIWCDQFQFDVATYCGGPAQTSNLDKLAAQSVNFRAACTTTALSSPTRASLYTGRWGHRTGLDDNCYTWHSRLNGLDLKQTTLLEWAREKDYFLGYFGKWHLGPDGPIRRGVHRFSYNGFDRGNLKSQKPNFDAVKIYYDKTKVFNEKPGYYNTVDKTYEETETEQLAKLGINFIIEATKAKLPFYLTVSFPGPHPPYAVPKEYATLYDSRKIELPANLHDPFKNKPLYQQDIMWPFHDLGHMTDDDWRKANAYYQGYVTMIDRAIGELLESLKKNGFWENTLIVFVSDHGDMIGAHGRFDKGPYAYDEVMRIPMLVRVPNQPAREIKRQVSIMDLNQTLVEWMNLEPDQPNVDSRSLFPLIKKGDSGWDLPDEIYYRYEWYNGLWFGIRTIRTPEFKYNWNPVGVDELYDLKNDPLEMINLINSSDFQETKKSLQRKLLIYLKQIDDPWYEKMKISI